MARTGIGWTLAACLWVAAAGCGKENSVVAPGLPGALNVTPDPLGIAGPGQTGQMNGVLTGSSTTDYPSSIFTFSFDPAVVSVGNPTGPPGGFQAVVTGVAPGVSAVTTNGQQGTASFTDAIVVIVWPGATWKGSVTLTGASCPGSQTAYNETAVITLNSSGAGTMTAMDTAGFNRPYSVTFQRGTGSTLFTATSSGTFSYLGLTVPGSVTADVKSATTLSYQETTNWGNCSNTYSGTLTRQ